MNVLQRAGGHVASPVRNLVGSHQQGVGRPSTDHLDPLSFLDSLNDKREDDSPGGEGYSIESYSIGYGGAPRAGKYEVDGDGESNSNGTILYGSRPRGKAARSLANDAEVSHATASGSIGRKPPVPTPVDPFASVSTPSFQPTSSSSTSGESAANQRQTEELRRALAALEESKQEAERLRQEKLVAMTLRGGGAPALQQPVDSPAVASFPSHIQQQHQDKMFDLAQQQKQQAALLEQHAAAVTAQLEKQRQELQQMMEAIQKEKQDMTARAEQAAVEKLRHQQEESNRAERERDELRSALEVMQMQNKLLASRMEKSQLESKQLLELERAERILAVSRMEGENRALLEAQERAQAEVAREREELRETMRKMGAEKNELLKRVEATEERAASESILVEMQKAEFNASLARLEAEKSDLAQRVQDNENQAKQATEAAAAQLAAEREELRQRMERMEADKVALAKTLAETDLQAKAAAEQLAAQLAAERAELKASMDRMEAEKKELVNHLGTAERAAQEQAAALSAQLAREKEDLRSALDRMEDEKRALAVRLEENEQRVSRVQQEASENVAKTMAETDLQAKAAAEQREELAAQLAAERAELKSSIDRMAREKEELASQLASTEQMSKKRDELMEERLGREKEELRLAVLRMKEEMLAERQAQLGAAVQGVMGQAAANASGSGVVANISCSASPASPQLLKPSTSLFDLLEGMSTKSAVEQAIDEAAAVAVGTITSAAEVQTISKPRGMGAKRLSKQLSRHNMVPHNIGSIPEGKEEDDTFMDTWSDDGSAAGSRAGSRRPSLQTAIFLQAQERGRALAEAQWSATLSTSASGGVESSGEAGEAMTAAALQRLQQQLKEKKDGDSFKGQQAESAPTEIQVQVQSQVESQSQPQQPLSLTLPEPEPEASQPNPIEDLPAPHAAAAEGDLSRLALLGDLEEALLASIDSAQRSPLFYASAYGQNKVVGYLVHKCPEMIYAVDVHGDTPLHAAASAGSIACLELLLSALAGIAPKPAGDGSENLSFPPVLTAQVEVNANPRNSMSMTPAHLAKSVDVLEVLFRYGANLELPDANGRSPVFVACAMNREDCAEYIISCLDKEGSSLDERDSRGDTPLHAAACNGAVDCLLLLLQFGVDPRLVNKKGLKAIDLAIRNKQKKCRDMLAEYHLHFCTGSDFDSVLFLATLEGHRQVKQLGGDQQYQIIKKQEAGGGLDGRQSSFRTLQHAQSMFSLKANKSLRLQKWGQWLAYEDPANPQALYWYNHATSTGQWTMPTEVVQMQATAASAGAVGSTGVGPAGLTHKLSMRLKKHGDWIEYATGSGLPFFYNERNGEFQWEQPADLGGSGGSAAPAAVKHSSSKSRKQQPQQEQQPQQSEAESWHPYKDPESGVIFWYNHVLGTSQWEEPAHLSGAGATRVTEDHEEVVNVMTDDDLGI